MFEKVMLIPTGDELRAGTVLDTDSPAVLGRLLRLNGSCSVLRVPPVRDEEAAVADAVRAGAAGGWDLLVLIGGSGGGHRYVPTLGKDFTQSALELLLEDKQVTELYGKNGHLWSKLLCGRLNGALVINLPGPFQEAEAAIRAFCTAYEADPADLAGINKAMAAAVEACYG